MRVEAISDDSLLLFALTVTLFFVTDFYVAATVTGSVVAQSATVTSFKFETDPPTVSSSSSVEST